MIQEQKPWRVKSSPLPAWRTLFRLKTTSTAFALMGASLFCPCPGRNGGLSTKSPIWLEGSGAPELPCSNRFQLKSKHDTFCSGLSRQAIKWKTYCGLFQSPVLITWNGSQISSQQWKRVRPTKDQLASAPRRGTGSVQDMASKAAHQQWLCERYRADDCVTSQLDPWFDQGPPGPRAAAQTVLFNGGNSFPSWQTSPPTTISKHSPINFKAVRVSRSKCTMAQKHFLLMALLHARQHRWTDMVHYRYWNILLVNLFFFCSPFAPPPDPAGNLPFTCESLRATPVIHHSMKPAALIAAPSLQLSNGLLKCSCCAPGSVSAPTRLQCRISEVLPGQVQQPHFNKLWESQRSKKKNKKSKSFETRQRVLDPCRGTSAQCGISWLGGHESSLNPPQKVINPR